MSRHSSSKSVHSDAMRTSIDRMADSLLALAQKRAAQKNASPAAKSHPGKPAAHSHSARKHQDAS